VAKKEWVTGISHATQKKEAGGSGQDQLTSFFVVSFLFLKPGSFMAFNVQKSSLSTPRNSHELSKIAVKPTPHSCFFVKFVVSPLSSFVSCFATGA
jgi:hypothetical protein